MRISPPLAVLACAAAIVVVAVWLAPAKQAISQVPAASSSTPKPAAK